MPFQSASLAYILVALCYLLPEAERCRRELNLPQPSFIERTNLGRIGVLGESDRLMAVVGTTNYLILFEPFGRLRGITKLDRYKPSLPEYLHRLASQTSVIDERGAHQLATQWLAAVGVDTALLGSVCTNTVSVGKLGKRIEVKSGNGRVRKTDVLPLYTVTWSLIGPAPRDEGKEVVKLDILGPTREIEYLYIYSEWPAGQSLYTQPRVNVPGALVLAELPNAPFTNLWNQRALSVTNVFGLLRTSTAYQSEMLRRMLEAANRSMRLLGLPEERQLKLRELTESFVAPPQFGFRGCLGGKDSFFQFDEQGNLTYLFLAAQRAPGQDISAHYHEWSMKPQLVTSNSVVELVTCWLHAIGVDTNALARDSTPKVRQETYRDPQGVERGAHVWFVWWPDRKAADRSLVYAQVNGANRNPDRIKIVNPAYLRRPGIGITNAAELMAVPDAQPQRDPLMAHWNVLDLQASTPAEPKPAR